MRELTLQAIFKSLSRARWDVASRTYGNSHATLIGLLVDWWISLSPDYHTALDGAPSHGAGQCDAVFRRRGKQVGVLEVEGTNPLKKLESIVNYFKSGKPALQSIWFGILVLYSTAPKGYGEQKQYLPVPESVFDSVKRATFANRGRAIIAMEVNKVVPRLQNELPPTSFFATTSKVTGILFNEGKEEERHVFFRS